MNAFKLTHNINLDEYETAFKNWINDIIEWLSGIFNNSNENENKETIKMDGDFLDIYNEDKIVVEIKETATCIANSLKTQNILNREYYDFLEIRRLLNNSLDEGNEKQLMVISDIIAKLNEITDLKFELLHQSSRDGNISFDFISEDSKKIFKDQYEKFADYYFDAKVEYYSYSNKKPAGYSKKYLNLMKDQIFN